MQYGPLSNPKRRYENYLYIKVSGLVSLNIISFLFNRTQQSAAAPSKTSFLSLGLNMGTQEPNKLVGG